MSYAPYLGALFFLALLSGPLSAQKSTVRQVAVRGSADAIEVEIQTSGEAVSPNTQVITGPDRIVVDFPGALPAAQLRALAVNRGPLKAVRSGLFFSNPPITRVVLDLSGPQPYRISSTSNVVVVKLGALTAHGSPAGEAPGARPTSAGGPNLQQAVLEANAPTTGAGVRQASLSSTVQTAKVAAMPQQSGIGVHQPSSASPALPDEDAGVAPAPARSVLLVSYENGRLAIYAERVTLSQVLFEVQRRTGAEIAIPAGAEQEQVVAHLGPAPARDVLADLLNGSPYNFIFVGNELSLDRVILTHREPSIFH